MKLARVLGAIGRTLITAGTLVLLFVVYQLWGTGLYTSAAQDRGRNDFCEQEGAQCLDDRGDVETASTDPDGATIETTPPSTAPSIDAPPEGDPAGQIVIPAIGVDWIFYEGVQLSNLKKGPGHYSTTPMPGQAGNAAIAGHRTTYGAPFGNVDQLKAGDEIFITTLQGRFVYKVLPEDQGGKQIVPPSAVQVLEDKGDNRLTLTACHPKYSARQRIIIVAELEGQPVAAGPNDRGDITPGEADLSLSGEAASKWPAILWGLLAAAVWAGAWLLGRKWRKWPAYAIGLPIFLVVLFFFFENFARLLPPNF